MSRSHKLLLSLVSNLGRWHLPHHSCSWATGVFQSPLHTTSTPAHTIKITLSAPLRLASGPPQSPSTSRLPVPFRPGPISICWANDPWQVRIGRRGQTDYSPCPVFSVFSQIRLPLVPRRSSPTACRPSPMLCLLHLLFTVSGLIVGQVFPNTPRMGSAPASPLVITNPFLGHGAIGPCIRPG